MLTNELARYLHDQQLGVYDPDGLVADGDIYIESMPDTPDTAICLYTRSSSSPDARNGIARPVIGVEVRGDSDPRTAGGLAQRIRDALHGEHQFYFENGGTKILLVTATEPRHLRTDVTGRHVYGVDLGMITQS